MGREFIKSPRLAGVKRRWFMFKLSVAATALLIGYQNCGPGFDIEKLAATDPGLNPGQNQNAPQSRFQCMSSEPPISTMQRLTKYEYVNTLRSLFGDAVLADPVVSLNLAGLPSDLLVGREEAGPAQDKHFDSYLGTGLQVGSLLFNSRTLLTALGINCVGTAVLDDVCLTRVAQQFGTLIYRRPLISAEVARVKSSYTDSSGTAAEKFQMLIASLLVSPDFLFHLEVEGGAVENTSLNSYRVSDWALASRLSYSIWGTMPDSVLMEAVKVGRLSTEAGLAQEFQRMLGDAKAKIHLRRLFADWLGFDTTPALSFSDSFLNGLNVPGLKEAMRTEFDGYIDDIVWASNGDYFDLMTSERSTVKSAELAKLYDVAPDANGLVSFSGKGRRGLLGKGIFLSRVGAVGTAVPIKRGAFMRAQLLCNELSRPSPQSLPEGVLNPIEIDPNQTTRAVVHAKTSAASCIGCHSQINPLGFALENFDPIGRLRTKELIFDSSGQMINSLPVDAKVSLSLDQKDVSIDGGEQLASALANSQEGRDCFTQKMFEAMAKRRMVKQDTCVLENMVGKLQGRQKKGSIRELIEAAVIQPNIRTRRVGAP